MAVARCEVITTVKSADAPSENMVNVLHFMDGTDFQALASALTAVFTGTVGHPSPFNMYSQRRVEVRTYDIADSKPRPIKGHSTVTPAGWGGETLGPRLLACCLSFYATRNLPRMRGRIYLGCFNSIQVGQENIGNAQMLDILNLGKNLFGLDPTWKHATYSPTEALAEGGIGAGVAAQHATNYWVDSRWDAMHSRELRATTRVTFP